MFSSVGGILSGITGNFGKTLIQSALTPAAIFVIVGLLMIAPYFPGISELQNPLDSLASGWLLLSLSLVVLIISLLIYMLNSPIVRFFEGYLWLETRWSRQRRQYYQSRKTIIEREWKILRSIRAAMMDLDDQQDRSEREQTRERISKTWCNCEIERELKYVLNEKPIKAAKLWHLMYSKIENQFTKREIALNRYFPIGHQSCMPTRLGNIIYSAEDYTLLQYKIDSVRLWPYLVNVMTPQYLESYNDARTNMLFFLNSAVLSVLLGLTIAAVGISTLIPLANLLYFTLWLLKIIIFTLLGYVLYLASVNQSNRYGNSIRAAFDLFRLDLLKKLGYDYEFTTRQQEMELWFEILTQIMYNRTPSGKPPQYRKISPPELHITPTNATVRISRGWKESIFSNRKTVIIEIMNVSKAKVTEVKLREMLPEGWVFIWGSAMTNKGIVHVSGKNELILDVSNIYLLENKKLKINYRVMPISNTHQKGVK